MAQHYFLILPTKLASLRQEMYCTHVKEKRGKKKKSCSSYPYQVSHLQLPVRQCTWHICIASVTVSGFKEQHILQLNVLLLLDNEKLEAFSNFTNSLIINTPGLAKCQFLCSVTIHSASLKEQEGSTC